MAEANPSLVFEQIRFLSDRFVRDCEKDKHPEIETYLQQVPDASRTSLLRNLLLAELEQRRRLQEDPQVEEYLERFPNDESTVRQVFSCSMTVSVQARAEKQDTSIGPDALSATEVCTAPPVRQLGNYLLIGELGRGGFGVVWEAEHVEQRYRVALKTLPSDLQNRLTSYDVADRLHKFRQEFRRLRDVNHPNLVGMQNLECDGMQWFFTMDLVKGVDFLSYVRPNGALIETRLRSALAQLVAGVNELHQRKIIHRDLKPSNVMVSDEGQVAILDFGLVVEIDQRQVSQTQVHFAGTPNYASPEQLSSEPTSASDWYAVGTMLYEALTGSLPYTDSNPYTLMHRKAEEDPPVIEDGDLPEDLVELALRLLQRDADKRPTSSELMQLFEVHSILEPTSTETLVGRETQLAELGAALSRVESEQQPLAMFVSGLSGEGKSLLVEQFLEPLRNDERFTVLSGRCYDRESVPFKALDNLIDALCSHLRRLGDKAAFLIPEDIAFLVSLFPVMKRVDAVVQAVAIQSHAEVDDQQVRHRAFSALRVLLQRLSRSNLVIIFADDLQWGDKDSAEALFQVLRPPDAPRILFLGSYRAEQANDSPFLREWHRQQAVGETCLEQRDVTVGPLDVQQCRELIAAQLDIALDSEAVAELLAESGGNPFLLVELLGCIDTSSGKVERLPLSEVIARKLRRLPQEASDLLNMICVSGQALRFDEALQATQLDTQAVSTATHMRNEKLIRLSGSHQELIVDTYHDKVRETVLSQLSPQVRMQQHHRLAEAIEQNPLFNEALEAIRSGHLPDDSPDRVFDLAYHFHQAGDSQRGFAYSLLAARQARRQQAFDSVLEQLERVRRVSGTLTPQATFHIAMERGEASSFLGRYEEAADEFEVAMESANGEIDRARVEALQGLTRFKQGSMVKSINYFESGLRRLGIWVPRSPLGLFMGIVREVMVQCGHSLFPRRLHRRQTDARIELIVQLESWFYQPLGFRNTFKMLWSHLAGLNRAELRLPSSGLAYSNGVHGMLMSMLGWHRRSPYYSDRGNSIAMELDDLWLKGVCNCWTGIGHTASAQFEKGIHVLNDAVESFDKVGEPFYRNLARFHIACCHYGLGDLAEAITTARDTFVASARASDSRTMCSSWLWARATEGNLPFDELRENIPDRPDDVMSTVHAVMAEGLWHSYHGRTEESLKRFEDAAAMVRREMCVNSHTILVMPMLARALRLRADALQPTTPEVARDLRKRSLRLAKWSARVMRLFPAARPLTLRELALAYRDAGSIKKALKWATKSCTVAKRQNAAYEQAQSALLCGELSEHMGLDGATEKTQSAKRELKRYL